MKESERTRIVPTSAHWGHYRAEVAGDQLKAIHPYPEDTHPAPIAQSMLDSQDARVRVSQPMVRAGYLEAGPSSDRAGRGREPFVPVSWDKAYELVAAELQRVIAEHGNESIYAGSYGWSSPGTLHVARSNMHRLLNLLGGFTHSIGSYSHAAYEALAPHIVGLSASQWVYETPSWQSIAEHAELVVMFGGAALKNAQVTFGGVGPHSNADDMRSVRDAGVQLVNISPIRADLSADFPAEWLAPRPNTDTAIMLGLAHTLWTEDLADRDYLERYTSGFDRFLPYLLGREDGQPKDPDWAAAISEIPADTIRALARRMASQKTVIAVNWAVQRAQYGEQPYWMAAVLASMLGEIGKPGRGLAYGLNSMHAVGSAQRPLSAWPELPIGQNPVNKRIPVARIADMLLNPGKPFHFNGQDWHYPDIRLVYWVGGNPFHHHQDLNRLIRAWQQPETIVVNEPFWTPTARYSDIILPAATVLERSDINFTLLSATISPVHQAVAPFAQARSDYDIFLGMAEKLNLEADYSKGRDEMGWLRHFYEDAREQARAKGRSLPDFEAFWLGDPITLTPDEPAITVLEHFVSDPDRHPLKTPSGKIEIYSEPIAAFGYDDCLAHPAWLAPDEWMGAELAQRFPLHLLSNQPKTRLHSQLDHARVSKAGKVHDREPAFMHPDDARARGIEDGSPVRIFNDRGACLTIVQHSTDLRPGVVLLPTGAWFNPADPQKSGSLEIHGNPNVLTRDIGTSKLGQATTANTALVEVERYAEPLPPVTVHDLPEMAAPTLD